MKTLETIAGNAYVITSRNGGTVTDSTGTLSKPVEAGDQLIVTAPSDRLLIDDDEAIMRQANFKGALVMLGQRGGGVIEDSLLPKGYMPLSFVQSDGIATMSLPFAVKGDVNKEFLCVHTLGLPTATSGEYAFGGLSVSSGYAMIYRAASQSWRFVNANETLARGQFLRGHKYKMRWRSYKNADNASKFNLELAHGADILSTQVGTTYTNNWTPAYNVFGTTDYNTKVGGATYELTIKIESSRVRYVPALDADGIPCLYGVETSSTHYKNDNGELIAGFSLEQARKLGSLPIGTRIEISLPVGWEEDAGVVAAKDAAIANGCELPIRTHAADNTEAATFALRRIWVRRAPYFNGAYVDADGVRWHLSWCEDVWGADPESLGYERFRSVDAAAEYWGLTPYEYPEDFLTEA